MREDRPQGGDIDGDLSALFQTMKGDKPPADLEERLLVGLAATTAVSTAGAVAAKVGFWKKWLNLLGGSAMVKSVFVGGACGAIVCGAWVIADPTPAAVSTASSTHGKSVVVAPPSSVSASNPLVDRPPAEPASTLSAPSSPVVSPSNRTVGAGQGGAPSLSDKGTPTAEPSSSSAPVVSPPSATDVDALQRELGEVRAIANLVDSGNCADARGKMAAYFANHPNGQLAGEVRALASRCAK